MPDQPKTPHRTIRVEEHLWAAAQAKAAREGTTVSEVIRRYLTRWTHR